MSEYDIEKKDLYWKISGLEIELKRYKNIEEELGIDLITLFKALTQGIWVKKNNKCYHLHKITMILEGMFLVDLQLGEESHEIFYFKDYGKNWALTKEELL